MSKRYYVQDEISGKWVRINHDEDGYYETDITDKTTADFLNVLQNNTEADIKAAYFCSLHGCWHNFNGFKERFECELSS